MCLPRVAQNGAARARPLLDPTVVNVARREKRKTAMPMLLVVAGEEGAAELTRLLDAPEERRETRPVFQCFELRFAKRVVVGDVRSRSTLRHAEIGVELSKRFGGH